MRQNPSFPFAGIRTRGTRRQAKADAEPHARHLLPRAGPHPAPRHRPAAHAAADELRRLGQKRADDAARQAAPHPRRGRGHRGKILTGKERETAFRKAEADLKKAEKDGVEILFLYQQALPQPPQADSRRAGHPLLPGHGRPERAQNRGPRGHPPGHRLRPRANRAHHARACCRTGRWW